MPSIPEFVGGNCAFPDPSTECFSGSANYPQRLCRRDIAGALSQLVADPIGLCRRASRRRVICCFCVTLHIG
jgi:hypothetical protein